MPKRKMRLLLTMLLLCTTRLWAADVTLTHTVNKAPKRGEGIMLEERQVHFDEAMIRYRAHFPPGQTNLLKEKWGDGFFGLFLGGFGGGGWDRWRFLHPKIRTRERTVVDPVKSHRMQDVYVLETGNRDLVDFSWPLDVNAPEGDARLLLTVIQSGGDPKWLFLRIRCEDSKSKIDTLTLSAYPANSAGPKVRERCVAVSDIQASLKAGAFNVPPESGGLMLFNQYAQDRDGCLLVYRPEEVKNIEARGNYQVRVQFQPAAETKEMHFALGYFSNHAWEDMTSRFFDEQLPLLRKRLDEVDWTPRANLEEIDALCRKIEDVLAESSTWPDVGSSEAERTRFTQQRNALRKEFETVRARYTEEKRQNQVRKALHCANLLRELKNRAYELALKELK